MDSMPPATIMFLSPDEIMRLASITDFIPLAHTLLIVVQMVSAFIPDPNATCLAGAYPDPALITFPIITSSTS
jgi:hypothetical protein